MKSPLATVISYIFHPLFVAAYGFSILLFTKNYFSYFFPLNVKLLLLAMTISFTCFLPVFNLYVLKRLKLITSLYLDNGKERTFPYVITSMFYLGMAYLIRDFHIPGIYISFLVGAAATILLTAIINLKWKISAHMMGIGGLAGSILAVSLILGQNFLMWFCFIILAAGLTGFARLELNAHTPKQVYVGFSLGMLTTFFLLIGAYIINLHTIF
ncbi:MAG: putative rane protein [Bacteroidetes bacterium]|jgi:hypothetical protein|nr:putative rane protein [Bacteroidota bacterium]